MDTPYHGMMKPKEAPLANPQGGNLSDAILPDHYRMFAIEPMRFAVENYGRGVLIKDLVKYVMRAPHKHEDHNIDMEKAKRCLDMLHEFDKGNPDWWKAPEERQPEYIPFNFRVGPTIAR